MPTQKTDMHLILVIFRYFPHGGLQRDMRLIAEKAVRRGLRVTVLAQKWLGDEIDGVKIITFPPIKAIGKMSSPMRNRRFFRQIAVWLADNEHDYLLSMNKIALPSVSGYFQGDECVKSIILRERTFFYRFSPRGRHFLKNEKAILVDSNCDLFMLSKPASAEFVKCYDEQVMERMTFLRAGLPTSRIWAQEKVRKIDVKRIRLLFVASNFSLKGLDRAILAIANLPQTYNENIAFSVIGAGKIKKFQKIANKHGIDVQFLGSRDDVVEVMRESDLLIHPARMENAGMVIIEALANALPVLTTGNCGYASLVEDNNAGLVLANPFSQAELNTSLRLLLSDTEALSRFSVNAQCFGKTLSETTIAEQVISSILSP